MTLYGQDLDGPDGSCGVMGCASREEAVERAVDLAISSDWSPPRWWHFNRVKWPEDCVAEYQRRQDG